MGAIASTPKNSHRRGAESAEEGNGKTAHAKARRRKVGKWNQCRVAQITWCRGRMVAGVESANPRNPRNDCMVCSAHKSSVRSLSLHLRHPDFSLCALASLRENPSYDPCTSVSSRKISPAFLCALRASAVKKTTPYPVVRSPAAMACTLKRSRSPWGSLFLRMSSTWIKLSGSM